MSLFKETLQFQTLFIVHFIFWLLFFFCKLLCTDKTIFKSIPIHTGPWKQLQIIHYTSYITNYTLSLHNSTHSVHYCCLGCQYTYCMCKQNVLYCYWIKLSKVCLIKETCLQNMGSLGCGSSRHVVENQYSINS